MALKEDQHTEFKEKASSGTIINEIVAFLNTCDGSIYVGVRDDGTIVGISDIDKTSLNISNIIADQIEPSPRGLVSIETPVMEGKRIVRIDVKKGEGLYYIKKYGMSSAGCFERIGTSSRGMTTQQVQRRMMAFIKSGLTITNLPSHKKNLTFKMIKFLFAQEGFTIQDSTFLVNEQFLDEDGNYNIQAELLADENRFSIKVVRFEGNDKGTKILLRNDKS